MFSIADGDSGFAGVIPCWGLAPQERARLVLRMRRRTDLGLRGRKWIGWVLLAVLPGVTRAETADLATLQSRLIPKQEVGADAFVAEHPTYDGRGVVIAVFDTGVDPAAAGLSVTTTGERKVVDIIDGTGSGDVDTSTVVQVDEAGQLAGLSGRTLTLPAVVENPSGDFRLGLKLAKELFRGDALKRLNDRLAEQWEAELNLIRAERERHPDAALKAAQAKAAEDRTRAEADLVAKAELREAAEDKLLESGPGAIYDCVVWSDGTDWRVVIDTDQDGDLSDETVLRPYGVAGEYGTFDEQTNATFGVQVYEEGDVLSIVTVSGTHATHVASIASAHYPDNPARNGIAPGARILSIKIGDIRTGGASYGMSERRALAAAARHGVDIVNASWGGSSIFQDGEDGNGTLYRRLVERYDILAILSAGNEGPALSTAGSAGGEGSRLLGIGAYASGDMAHVLYNAVERSPDAALQFSSRGPTKDGDIGVDVMAPGAAWASYSAESLRGAEMINGTSMAAPNAAGVAALVISAAKQNQVAAPPVLMRQALMLGARPLPGEDIFTAGHGMVNAGGAWQKLQDLQGQEAFRPFYDLSVSGGTFTSSGRGLYLRESLADPRQRIGVSITPGWSDSVDAKSRYGWEADFELVAADDWVQAPDFLHLANGRRNISIYLEIPPADAATLERGGVLTSRVDAFVEGERELGPVFSIPFTVVRPANPEQFVANRLKTTVQLEPSRTERLFYEVPAGVERLQLKAKHVAEDPISRRFFVQAVTVAAASSQAHYKGEEATWVDEGEEFEMNIPVKAGRVTELAFNQYFYSPGATELQLDLKWVGVGAPDETVTIEPNQGWKPLELNPGSTLEASIDPKLKYAVSVYLPKTTKTVFDGDRGELPKMPWQPWTMKEPQVRVQYELEFKDETKAHILDLQDYDAGDGIGGGRLRVLHESGELLYEGFQRDNEAIEFPAGKTTVVVEWAAFDPAARESVRSFPLRIARPLKISQSLNVTTNLRTRFGGGFTKKLKLEAGRQHITFIQDSAIDDMAKLSPKPDYVQGTFSFSDEADHPIISLPLRYFVGESPRKVTNQDPEAKPAKDVRSAAEQLDDTLVDEQLDFVREQRFAKEADIQARRQSVLAALLDSQPEDPRPWIERAIDGAVAAGYASEFWGKPKEDAAETEESDADTVEDTEAVEEPVAVETVAEIEVPDLATIQGWLDEAEQRAEPTRVSEYLGTNHMAAPGDLEARDQIAAEKKKIMAKRDALAVIARLRTDLLRATGDVAGAWQQWTEIARWEPKAEDETKALEKELYRADGLSGLVLQALNAQIEEKPLDAKLLEERIALYRELGWERAAVEQERLLALRKVRQAELKRLE